MIRVVLLDLDALKGKQRSSMGNERFNMSLRKYLKHVGVTSQQEIERLVREHGLEGKCTKLSFGR